MSTQHPNAGEWRVVYGPSGEWLIECRAGLDAYPAGFGGRFSKRPRIFLRNDVAQMRANELNDSKSFATDCIIPHLEITPEMRASIKESDILVWRSSSEEDELP